MADPGADAADSGARGALRKLAILLVTVLSISLTACSGPVAIDPYELTGNVLTKPPQLVQLNIGFGVHDGQRTTRISPEMIRVVLDTSQQKALVNVAIPGAALGLTPEELAMGMLPGGRIEFDMLLDADALYARAPFLADTLPFMLMGLDGGGVPEGDFRGWLRLATADELEALGEMMSAMQRLGGGPTPPDLTQYSELTPAQLKELLQDSGITLSDEGVEDRNGVPAHHVSVSVDYDAMAGSALFKDMLQVGPGAMPINGSSFTTDFWFAQGTGMPLEISLAGWASESEQFEMLILFSEPDPGTTFDPPATFVDIPLVKLLGPFVAPFPGQIPGDGWDDMDEDWEWNGEWDDEGWPMASPTP